MDGEAPSSTGSKSSEFWPNKISIRFGDTSAQVNGHEMCGGDVGDLKGASFQMLMTK